MNNPLSMKPTAKQQLAVKAKNLEGQEEADTKVYTDEKGFLRFPAMAFRSALITASVGRKFGKSSASGVFKGSVFAAEDWVQILDSKTWKPRKDYEVDTRRVVNPSTGGSTPRSRPIVKNWACKLPLEVDEQLLGQQGMKDLLDILNHAGKTVGIGDFRPRCPRGVGGPFGRFSAELMA
jgi:hypothetical protein